MAIDTTIQLATALAGANVLLLAALTVVWVRNYRTFRTTLVLGLIAFGAVMGLENALAVYYFLSMHMLYSADPGVMETVLLLRALQFVAIGVLTWVTLK